MPIAICLYHPIWSTKERAPILTAAVEAIVADTIKHKSAELGCPIFAINMHADHIHVAVSIVPALSVSEWASKVKGVSSRAVNVAFPDLDFAWQRGYGVLTFGEKHLKIAQEYIERQKEHHQNNTLFNGMEHTDE
ncbi:MAG: IS200/IS605 family transposase [Anaerolineae bacterium]|nr:IS200/IS605 family transposase [Anaerolineae bacterium]